MLSHHKFGSKLLFLCLIVNILLGHCLAANAQHTPHFQPFTQNQGLSNDFVSCFLQDHLGFTWMGTDNGLNRFDGYQFIAFQHDPQDSESLAGNKISSLFEDSQNRLWVGTTGGLAYLDRVKGKFIRLPLLSADKTTPVVGISSIFEDSQQNLWFGTEQQGLVYLPNGDMDKVDSSRCFLPDPSITPKEISKIQEDNQGNLWLEHKDGVTRMERQTERFLSFALPTQLELEIPLQNYFPQLALEQVGLIKLNKHLSTGLYLRQYVPAPLLRKFVAYYRQKTNLEKEILPTLHQAIRDQQNNIWLGSDFGLFKIDLDSQRILHYPLARPGSEAYSKRIVKDLYIDPKDRLWLAISGHGFTVKQAIDFPINHFASDPLDPNSISGNQIQSIQEDASGKLWVGTASRGLDELVFAPQQGWVKNRTLQHQPGNPQSLSNNNVTSILIDGQNNCWIGTALGLNFYTPTTQEWKLFLHDPNDNNSISGNHPWVIHEDKQGILWIGDYEAGLNRFDPTTGDFRRYLPEAGNPNSISSKQIRSIHEDQDGILWIGTNMGLNRFDKETGRFTRFIHDPNDPNSLSDNLVWAVLVDKEGNVWAGTSVGLNKLHQKQNHFVRFYEKDGLPSNVIHGLVEDRQNHLWVSTDRGLARIQQPNLDDTKSSLQLQVFTAQDGLEGNHFLPGVAAQSLDGNHLYFGGLHGFNSLLPSRIIEDTITPNFQLSSFSSLNRKDERGLVMRDPFIGGREQLVLTPIDQVVSFQVSDLLYQPIRSSKVEYQLKGFSESWLPLADNRYITFTGLQAGNYTLQLRMEKTGKEVVAESKLLNIKVLPPWWKSRWAYSLYALVFAAMAFLGYRNFRKRQLENQEGLGPQELDTFKNRFYSYITNEFRTPLTIIGGMVEQIQKSPQQYLDQGIKMIERNSKDMLNQVDQILDLRRIETGKLALKLVQGDIIAYLRSIVESFGPLREGIQLHFLHMERELIMDYDQKKMVHIMSNLLSYVVQSIPKDGDVYVTVDRQGIATNSQSPSSGNSAATNFSSPSVLLITIKNTGGGIPKEQIATIFERFYQTAEQNDLDRLRRGEGTGIGLTLSKELIHLLNGRIEVESEEGVGSTFRIILPISKEAVLVDDKDPDTQFLTGTGEHKPLAIPQLQDTELSGPHFQDKINPKSSESADFRDVKEEQIPVKETTGQSTILIIDDNPDMVFYLEGLLRNDYQLSVAKDGEEGINKALQDIPDMIICDIRMPKKDGFEVCATLKKDERTSHIPIIILTAKADDEARIRGLGLGADAYLSKPFNQEELLIRLKKLHELRLQLQDRYSALSVPTAKTSSRPKKTRGKISRKQTTGQTDIEDAFINKIRKIVEKRMKSKKFGIPELCKEMGMSRSQLHLKIKALTNRSTSHFVRGVRLQKAKELLQEGNTTVSEVSKKVGFPDPAYFSRTFTEEFGSAPREFLND